LEAHANPDAADASELRALARRALAEASLPGLPIYVLAWTLLGLAVGFAWPRPLSSYLIGLILLVATAWRGSLILKIRRHPERCGPPWLLEFSASVLFGGMGVGILIGLLVLDQGLHDGGVLSLTIVAALGSASAFAFAPDRKLCTLFLLVLNVPLMVALLIRGGSLELVTFGADLVFLGYCLGFSRRVHREFWLGLSSQQALRQRAIELEAARASLRLAADELEVQVAAAQTANRAKSEFLANMSHEVRTPLNGVLGCSRLLLDSKLDAVQLDLVETLRACGEDLLGTVNQILDLSKLEADRLELEAVVFDLPAAIGDVVAIHRPAAMRKGLALGLELAPELAPYVIGDLVHLKQVLSNLVANAIKFTSRGKIDVRVSRQGKLYRFEVEDTGIGFDESQQEKLFEAFYQADSSTTRRYGGTGLGLSIVRSLAQRMHGQSGAESKKGVGSLFWFTAELEESALAPRPYDAAPPTLRRAKILLVEDNAVNRRIQEAYLEMLGQEVHSVVDGVEAIAACQKEHFDLILMDCQMPNLDGYEATRRIRQSEGTRRTPIVALTASTLEKDRERCLAAGMDDHLGKPLVLEELAGALAKWLTMSPS